MTKSEVINVIEDIFLLAIENNEPRLDVIEQHLIDAINELYDNVDDEYDIYE